MLCQHGMHEQKKVTRIKMRNKRKKELHLIKKESDQQKKHLYRFVSLQLDVISLLLLNNCKTVNLDAEITLTNISFLKIKKSGTLCWPEM